MVPSQIIARKRDGFELSRGEIGAFVADFTSGDIPDYQMAALAMAIYLRGMTTDETASLTEEMLNSGTRLQWDADVTVVDKHSTGGIGDKTSLILAPLLACCGLTVPMISGRGLGATGGTLDKLESIPGFRTDLSLAEIQEIAGRIGCVITGASEEIAPADKRLYALRDVTATVPSIPLITASIMSKKLAESLDALVLDVKFGSGAFMKSYDQARELALSLVATGKRMGVKTAALLTDMNQPLGRMAGNAVEVHEAMNCLRGQDPSRLWECTRELGIELLLLAQNALSREEAAIVLEGHIATGRALTKFREMVAIQGGDLDRLPDMAPGLEIHAQRPGYVAAVDAEALGLAIIELGGGRKMMTDKIDHAVGLEMWVRIGEPVEAGQPLIRLFGSRSKVRRVEVAVRQAIVIGDEPVKSPRLTRERIE